MAIQGTAFDVLYRGFSSSSYLRHIIKLTRLRVVDNSELGKQAELEGRPARCLQVYNHTEIGTTGDLVLVAICGQKKKGVLVGVKQKQKPKIPKFDTNNLVLVEPSGAPLGTRINVAIPHIVRTMLKKKTYSKGPDYTKILAIASKFI